MYTLFIPNTWPSGAWGIGFRSYVRSRGTHEIGCHLLLQIGLQCSAGVVTVDPVIHKIVAVVPRQGQQSSHHCLQHSAMLCIDLVSSQQGSSP